MTVDLPLFSSSSFSPIFEDIEHSAGELWLATKAPLVDGVTWSDLVACWQGTPGGPFAGRPLLAAPDTVAVLAQREYAPVEHFLCWHGEGLDGERVAPGEYTVRLNST